MIESKNFTFDKVIPFTLKKSKIRGRFVKLDNSISKILNRHNYELPISLSLSEILSVSCCIGSLLKFDGNFIIQGSSKEILKTILADYSSNGSIIDGQSWYSNYSVESDTANYIVHKEYEVSMENAELRYYQSNLGSCISDSGVINQNVLESDCPDLNTWVVNGQTIEDCIKVTRTITTTMLGPGIDFKLKSETYLKEGFPVVKEDIYWSWPPTFEGERIFTKISSIEACGLECESINSCLLYTSPSPRDS